MRSVPSSLCKIPVTRGGFANFPPGLASRLTMWGKCLSLLLLVALLAPARAAEGRKSEAADLLFRDAQVRVFRLEVSETALSALRQGNHEYVRATFSGDGVTLRDVGIRLKGHGTFQPVERKPAFALKFNEFTKGQEFLGMAKLLLNNSSLDASYLREWLATQVYRDAGLPAARAAHVRVILNGRDLGLYVALEPMNKSFLKRELGAAGGNLYEGESRDVDKKLDQESGDDTTQKDLRALVAAAESPLAGRWQKMNAVLDVEGFAAFLAVAALTAGTDGYAFTRNNYRIYHHPKTDRLVFLPHGLDGTFGSAGFVPPTNSLVVKALWPLPEFRQLYRTNLAGLGEKIWRVEELTNRIHAATAKLHGANTDPKFAAQLDREATVLKHQIVQQRSFFEAEMRRWEREAASKQPVKSGP